MMLFRSKEFRYKKKNLGFRSRKCRPLNWPSVCSSVVIFHYHFVGLQTGNLCNWWAFKSQCGCIQRLSSKMAWFGILNSCGRAICLGFIRSNVFIQQNRKIENSIVPSQPAFTCSKLAIETHKVWNMFKVNNKDTRTTTMASFWSLYC